MTRTPPVANYKKDADVKGKQPDCTATRMIWADTFNYSRNVDGYEGHPPQLGRFDGDNTNIVDSSAGVTADMKANLKVLFLPILLQVDPSLQGIDDKLVNTILTKYVFAKGWKTGDDIRIPRRKDTEPDINDTGYRWGVLTEDAAASVADGGKREDNDRTALRPQHHDRSTAVPQPKDRLVWPGGPAGMALALDVFVPTSSRRGGGDVASQALVLLGNLSNGVQTVQTGLLAAW